MSGEAFFNFFNEKKFSMAEQHKVIFLSKGTLKSWLLRERWEGQQLVNWLQGYDFSPVGHDEEPFRWILRCLPTGEAKDQARTTLAERLATLLEQNPDITPIGDRPEEFLYNLFMLCAVLGCPAQLHGPLFAVFERQKLQGQWFGIDLRAALRIALIKNQIDESLLPMWEVMSNGKKHAFLPGDEFDGFDGARFIPGGLTAPNAPALNVIGKALKGIARRLEKEPTRRTKFRTLVNRVIETYPGRPTWDRDLITQAHQHQWPGWAVECLPHLYVQLAALPNRGERAWLWHYIAACIPKTYEHRVVKKLCNNHVVEIELGKEAARFVEQIAPIFEEKRVSNPFASERAAVGAAASAMEQAELNAQARGDRMEASTFKVVRAQLLKQKGVADVKAIGEALARIAQDRSEEYGREAQFRSFCRVARDIYPEKTVLVGVKKLPSWAAESLSQAEA
jgi:hypothetical protein